MNPILETVGIINLERDADPVQQTIGILMEMVESLGGDVKSIASALQQVRLEQDAQNRIIANTAASRTIGGGGGGLFSAPPLPPNYNALAAAGGGILGGLGVRLPLDQAASSHTPPDNPLKPSGKPPQKKWGGVTRSRNKITRITTGFHARCFGLSLHDAIL